MKSKKEKKLTARNRNGIRLFPKGFVLQHRRAGDLFQRSLFLLSFFLFWPLELRSLRNVLPDLQDREFSLENNVALVSLSLRAWRHYIFHENNLWSWMILFLRELARLIYSLIVVGASSLKERIHVSESLWTLDPAGISSWSFLSFPAGTSVLDSERAHCPGHSFSSSSLCLICPGS